MLAKRLLQIMSHAETPNPAVSYISNLDFTAGLTDKADDVSWSVYGYADVTDRLRLSFPNRVSGTTNYIYRTITLPEKFKIDIIAAYAHSDSGNGWGVPLLATSSDSLAAFYWETLQIFGTGVTSYAQNTDMKLTLVFDAASVDIYVNDVYIRTIQGYTHPPSTTLVIGDNGLREWVGGSLVIKKFTIVKLD